MDWSFYYRIQPNFSHNFCGLLQVAHCYQDELSGFPEEIHELLKTHASALDSELRMTLCRALILLQHKNMFPIITLLELFFRLLRVNDKLLRKMLYTHIITDIKRLNVKRANNQVNLVRNIQVNILNVFMCILMVYKYACVVHLQAMQNFMYAMLQDSSPVAGKMSLDVLIELYRKNIWNNTKTVQVIATACFSKTTKIMVAALKFFLGSEKKNEEESDEDDSSDDDVRELFY